MLVIFVLCVVYTPALCVLVYVCVYLIHRRYVQSRSSGEPRAALSGGYAEAVLRPGYVSIDCTMYMYIICIVHVCKH